jgi:predicted O-methyltransferase YrrM
VRDWIEKLFEMPALTGMGHLQTVPDANLGLGWIYYGLARVVRPRNIVVIGSYRGFVPLVLGKALSDNQDGGRVVFIDPSMVDDFWKDAANVRAHFSRYEVANVEHHLMTTEEFIKTDAYASLGSVGMVFIDGYHSEEAARFDFNAFQGLLAPEGVILLHDTVACKVTQIYGADRAYERRVKVFVDQLKRDNQLQVFDLPFGQGVTLVRKLQSGVGGRK